MKSNKIEVTCVCDQCGNTITIHVDNPHIIASREGGIARTKKLSATQRSEIARRGGQARWKSKSINQNGK